MVALVSTPRGVVALGSKAEQIGIKPTVLARNLIHVGLNSPYGDAISRAVDHLETAVDELRGLVR